MTDHPRLKERFEDEDDACGRKCHSDTWPPKDANGNEYPLDWFDVDDLSKRGELYDSNYRAYSPFAGNLEPVEGKCNSFLSNWRERYPSVRYCGQFVAGSDVEGGSDLFCNVHKGQEGFVKTAEETLQTGAYTKTVDHHYDKLGPWERLLGWGFFESLMGESSYDFAEEYDTKTFDFSESEVSPTGVDEEGELTVQVARPTAKLDPSTALLVAAFDTVAIINVQVEVMRSDTEDQKMLSSKETSNASLTSPTEVDPSQEWKTLEEWSEHHLNLPLSRLISDRKDLLERGGVTSDVDESAGTQNVDSLTLNVPTDEGDVAPNHTDTSITDDALGQIEDE